MKILKTHRFALGEIGFEIDKWPDVKDTLDFHTWRYSNNIDQYVRLGHMMVEFDTNLSKRIPLIVVESTNPDPICTLCILKWG